MQRITRTPTTTIRAMPTATTAPAIATNPTEGGGTVDTHSPPFPPLPSSTIQPNNPVLAPSLRHRSLVRETAGMFHSAEPFIQREIARKTWIYDIIEGRRESEHVHFNSDQFVILPDSDSQPPQQLIGVPSFPLSSPSLLSGSPPSSATATTSISPRAVILHWLTIFKDMSLRSIRDLRGHGGSGGDGVDHLPMLRRLRSVLHGLFPLQDTMMYFHYPPSVWQLHLHIAHPCDQLRTTNEMQKVHFLDDVILNLQIDPDYYAKATITYVLSSNHDLVRTYNHIAHHNSNPDHAPGLPLITPIRGSGAGYYYSHQHPVYHHHRRNNSSDEDAGSSASSLEADQQEPQATPSNNNTNSSTSSTGKRPEQPRHPQKNNAPNPASQKHSKHDGSAAPTAVVNPPRKNPPAPTSTTAIPVPFPTPRRHNRQATARIAPRATADPLPA